MGVRPFIIMNKSEQKQRKQRMQEMQQTKKNQIKFWEACKCGSVEGAQKAIAAGADIHLIDDREGEEREHCPALVLAACGCYPGVISVLLDAGADVESANHFGVTALMEAASSLRTKAVATVELLIERGADVNKLDCDGESVIMKAAEEGCMATVKVLINKGANPNLQDSKGRDAVQIAEKGEHAKVAMLLKIVGSKMPAGTPFVKAAPAEQQEEEGVRGSSTHVDLNNLKDSGSGDLSAEEFAALRAKTKSAAEVAKNMTPEQQAAYGCKTGVAASAVRADSDDSDDEGADFQMGAEGQGALLADY